MRQHRGTDGRYGIPKLIFYLYRLTAFRVAGVTPHARAAGNGFTFDPSGRDAPLFMPRNRPQDASQNGERAENWDAWRPAREWELPAPMRCRLLAEAKGRLIPNGVCVEEAAGTSVRADQVAAGDLAGWTASAPGKRLVIDPARGRFLFVGAPPAPSSSVTYHYGFPGEIGAGTYDRREVEGRKPKFTHHGGGPILGTAQANNNVTQIDDSATYGPLHNKLAVRALTLQAANQQRPYLRLQSNWLLNTGQNKDSTLLLDGLWLGGAGSFAVVLRGDYERVTIRSCTFDPGGRDAEGLPIQPLALVVEAQVEELVIEKSIMGPIRTQGGGALENVTVRDSIIQGATALGLPASEVRLERVTVFGAVNVNRLWATEALVTAQVDVTDTQNGCFRFGAAPTGSRLPRPYESHFISDANSLFTSRRFGDPGYGQLSEAAPVEIRRGAENGSEIGAFSQLLNPIRLESLQAKVEEYMPFGLIPLFVYET